MKTTRVFKSGNSQAVRLPREFQFDVDEVEIYREDDRIVLRRKPDNLVEAFELLAGMPEDFFSDGRQQPTVQEREGLEEAFG